MVVVATSNNSGGGNVKIAFEVKKKKKFELTLFNRN